MAPNIPDRWLDYRPCGNVIEGTRIICFKVPLKSHPRNKLTNRWTIRSLLQEIPDLSAVIDLTNTHRYYNPEELVSAGVKHKKILMQGRIVPPESAVREFMKTMDMFLKRNDDSLIGVHCTHGLNRTGYMVCRYMRDRLGMSAWEAIKKFEIARGYRIERQNFINDLLGQPHVEPFYGGHTTIIPVKQRRRTRRNRQK